MRSAIRLAATSASIATPARSSSPSRPRWPIASPLRASVEISAKTRLLTVIGDPVAHSLSPAMHNAAFRALGIDAVYLALRVPAESLPAVLAAEAAIGGAGNVTVPHKEAVEPSVARKTACCARVGVCYSVSAGNGGRSCGNTARYAVSAPRGK